MRQFRQFSAAILAALCVSSASAARPNEEDCPRAKVEKREGPGVWRPGPGVDEAPLWPDGLAIQAPETDGKPEWIGNGSPLIAGRLWNWASYVSRPTMTVYKPKGRNTRTAMLVLPGGGYAAVAMDLEGTEICDWITAHGVTCVILKYRVPQTWPRDKHGAAQPPKVQLPLQDAQRAMGLLRHRASAYGIDPNRIGVIGFSAGAHLAAAVSNAEQRTYELVDAADRASSRPDYAILLYPGRHWDRGSPEPGLHLAPWLPVSAKAPPTLLIHAMNDSVNDVRHSMAYGLALNDAGVPVDMRLYAKGCHAFGLRATSDPITREWPGAAVTWLQNLSLLPKADTRGPAAPVSN